MEFNIQTFGTLHQFHVVGYPIVADFLKPALKTPRTQTQISTPGFLEPKLELLNLLNLSNKMWNF